MDFVFQKEEFRRGRVHSAKRGCAAGPPGLKVCIDLDPGLLRQMGYGLRDWTRADLTAHFGAMGMTETTAEACIGLLPEILTRLLGLAERINALAAVADQSA
jgi:hypothetical protein